MIGFDDLVSQSGPNGIASSQQPGARRCAYIGTGIKAGKPYTFPGHAIEIGCFNQLIATDGEIAIAQIVS